MVKKTLHMIQIKLIFGYDFRQKYYVYKFFGLLRVKFFDTFK